MKTIRIGCAGFGGVAVGFIDVLLKRRAWLQSHFGCDVVISCVKTANHGELFHAEGLPLNRLRNWRDDRSLLQPYAVESSDSWISSDKFDVLIELTPTDLNDPSVAVKTIQTALNEKIHVISANKGPFAKQFPSLREQAILQHCFLGFEATVMAGSPCISVISSLRSNGITKMTGVVNGTCNFILGSLESGNHYNDALILAQKKGFAETDPSADVDGHDTLAKALILSYLAFGKTPDDIKCSGIRDFPTVKAQQANQLGSHVKLIAEISEQKIVIHPQAFDASHPLSQIKGAENGLAIESNFLGTVHLRGPGAGTEETGAGIMQDLVRLITSVSVH